MNMQVLEAVQEKFVIQQLLALHVLTRVVRWKLELSRLYGWTGDMFRCCKCMDIWYVCYLNRVQPLPASNLVTHARSDHR